MILKSSQPSVNVGPSREAASTLHQPPPWPDAAAHRPVAVLVCHGMGQQVPFETITGIASQLRDPASPASVVQQVRFVNAHDPGRTQWLPRAEIEVADPAGGAPRPVHVYEAYWAPLTEGAISLTEVVQFLVSAGLGGVWRSFTLRPPAWRRFERWVFGREQDYGPQRLTPWLLLGALLVVAGLVGINSILTLVFGTHAVGLAAQGVQTVLLAELTTDLLWLLGTAVVAVGLLWLSMRRHRRAARAGTLAGLRFGLLEVVGGAATAVLLLVVVGIALAMAYHYQQLRNGAVAHLTLSVTGHTPTFARWAVVVVWAAAAGASLAARQFLVQFMGDVAIYLNSYKVDKFNAVRQQIKALSFNTACTIYGARDGAALAYDRVVMVGHSLGSVVAYDTLNAMLNLDESMPAPLHVAGRTSALITYGSPLDKTAFLFDLQHPEEPMRDALAASVQPLIRSVAVRTLIRWVNIYSWLDIISGALEFYELPNGASPTAVRVKNKKDPQAITPLMAHAQYGANPLLLAEIRAAL